MDYTEGTPVLVDPVYAPFPASILPATAEPAFSRVPVQRSGAGLVQLSAAVLFFLHEKYLFIYFLSRPL